MLRDGAKTGSGVMGDCSRDELIRRMVGREVIKRTDKQDHSRDEELLRVEGLSFRNPANPADFLARDIRFALRRGEVLGVYGLMGSGRTEVLEAIFGLHPKFVTGEIRVEGKPVRIRSIGDAIGAGIGLVPEDRKSQGLVLIMDIIKNTSLARLANSDALSTGGMIRSKKEEVLCDRYMKELEVKLSDPRNEVQTLSGGNQQKVVIAKWLATQPKILLLDEPTRGVDMGAKGEIYALIQKLAEAGMGIVVVSSELPEIQALSDNVLVFSESRLTGRLTRAQATEENIMKAALAEKEDQKTA
ncbi:MAG: ATP-binding cassette domain-containing protein [Bacteroidales bacterium]